MFRVKQKDVHNCFTRNKMVLKRANMLDFTGVSRNSDA